MTFKDHFSTQADEYAKYRLTYPTELFEYLASLAPAHEMVWDCATGNGQAAHGLRAHFTQVFATDAAERQIENAVPGDGIEYSVAPAEASGLPAGSADAVTVATAFHWLDHKAFAREATRVGRDGALVAVWTYAYSDMPEHIRAVTRELVAPKLEKYWAKEVRRAWDGYRGLHFPFDEVESPQFRIERNWTADQFMAYANTWSAVQSFVKAHQHSPFDEHADALRAAWGQEPITVTWPLRMRAGYVRKG